MVKEQKHGKKVDVWSIGILAYEFVNGAPPFESDDHAGTYDRIKKRDLTFTSHVTTEFKDLVSRILHLQPEMRLTIDEIQNHPWIQKNVKSKALSSPPHK